jgi:hypothetical protein
MGYFKVLHNNDADATAIIIARLFLQNRRAQTDYYEIVISTLTVYSYITFLFYKELFIIVFNILQIHIYIFHFIIRLLYYQQLLNKVARNLSLHELFIMIDDIFNS